MKQLNGVTFDEHGLAIGKDQSPFALYVGRVTKAMISILIDDWRKKHYGLKNDDYKTQVLKLCNQFWKSFKKDLRTDYMYKKRSPCDTYMFIKHGTWKEFVKMESTPEKMVAVHNPNYTNDHDLLVSTKPLPTTVQPVQSGKQDIINDPICTTYTHYYMESYPGLLAYAQTTAKLQRIKYVGLDPVE
ncbi:hypothetical protein Tco_0065388 [Tanacetum coccineum]